MELLNAIHTRRSIRKFEDTPVSDEMVRTILEAAMMAPSAGNQQPWHFVVINDRATLDATANIHPYVAMVKQAPLGILICAEPALEKFPGYWIQDCSAAMQNLLLAAHDLGLGGVWTGVYPKEDRVAGFRQLLNIPDDIIPMGFVPIGWPAQESKSQDRFREDRIHINTY